MGVQPKKPSSQKGKTKKLPIKYDTFYIRPQTGEGNSLATNLLRSWGKVPEEVERGLIVQDIWMQVYQLTEQELKELVKHLRTRDPQMYRYFGRKGGDESVEEIPYSSLLGRKARQKLLLKRLKRGSHPRSCRAAMTVSKVAPC